MKITHLTLCNFRNYKEAHFTFSPHVNCILGGNAQGKTNLLEALYLLSTGRSFRTPHLIHLIREGTPAFHIEGHFIRDHVAQTLRFSYNGQKREIIHNRTPLNSSAQLFGLLPVTIYAPEDVHLITGSPSKRRRFIDMHIAQYDPLYLYHLVRYYRAMKQRNALLKAQTLTAISNWEQQMTLSATYLIEARKKALHALLPHIQAALTLLSDARDQIDITYDCTFPQYEKTRQKELRFGTTLHGPHKDDLNLLLNNREAKIYSSEGQKRSYALSLRLSEWERLKEQIGAPPLLCLDDFGSHLDDKRQTILRHRLPSFKQVFLTTPQTLPSSFAANTSTHHIQEGQLVPH